MSSTHLEVPPRKPVPSLSVATGEPRVHGVTPEPADGSWSKDVEKNDPDVTLAEDGVPRVSTEIELDAPESTQSNKKAFYLLGKEITVSVPSMSASNIKNVVPGSKKAGRRFSQRFGQDIGGKKTYLGLSKNWFLLSLASTVIILLALVIGLAVGLKRIKRSQDLPLPNNTGIHTGDLTYYATGLGACGITNKASDSIVAVSHLVFDAAQSGSDPNANPLCGKKIRINRFDASVNGNRSVDVTVTDRCVGCKATDLDVTTSVFTQVADIALGRVTTDWAWLT